MAFRYLKSNIRSRFVFFVFQTQNIHGDVLIVLDQNTLSWLYFPTAALVAMLCSVWLSLKPAQLCSGSAGPDPHPSWSEQAWLSLLRASRRPGSSTSRWEVNVSADTLSQSHRAFITFKWMAFETLSDPVTGRLAWMLRNSFNVTRLKLHSCRDKSYQPFFRGNNLVTKECSFTFSTTDFS